MPVRVLVADDDATSRTMVAAMLRGDGYEVALAADGHEAWEILQRTDAPRLAVVDWDMPGLEGVEISRRLRANATPTYVILLTSRSSAADIAAAFAAGADDYVVKPPQQAELMARVRRGVAVIMKG